MGGRDEVGMVGLWYAVATNGKQGVVPDSRYEALATWVAPAHAPLACLVVAFQPQPQHATTNTDTNTNTVARTHDCRNTTTQTHTHTHACSHVGRTRARPDGQGAEETATLPLDQTSKRKAACDGCSAANLRVLVSPGAVMKAGGARFTSAVAPTGGAFRVSRMTHTDTRTNAHTTSRSGVRIRIPH
jgi:hypothetical protein